MNEQKTAGEMLTEAVEEVVSGEEQKPKLNAYDLFLMKHIDRVNSWIAKHKEHQKLPITVDEHGNFSWMNREQRRKKK